MRKVKWLTGKYLLGILVLTSFLAGGVYWHFSQRPEVTGKNMTRYDFFNLEGILEGEFAHKNYDKIGEVLKSVGPHVKKSESSVDQYIYEYYSFRLQFESLTSSAQIQDLNQFFYRMSELRRRLDEIKISIFNLKTDVQFKNHWADKVDALVGQVDKKQSHFASLMRTLPKGQKTN